MEETHVRNFGFRNGEQGLVPGFRDQAGGVLQPGSLVFTALSPHDIAGSALGEKLILVERTDAVAGLWREDASGFRQTWSHIPD